MKKKVCIIGAGISGLVTAKVLLEDSDIFDVQLFEKSHEFAGVWSASRAYKNLCTNNAKYTFNFSDMPLPDHYEEYPTAEQMLEYFTTWANKHKLIQHVQFNTEVVHAKEVKHGAESKWEITTRTSDGKETTTTFDFLAVCSGLFEHPFMPAFENSAKFQGRILHSSGLVDPAVVKDKRVLIIGSAKSAADMVSMCGEYAKSGLMAFRKPHWLVPRYLGGKISTRFIFYGRWYRYITSYYTLDAMQNFMQTIGKFFCNGFWAFAQFGTVQDMKVPKDSPLLPDFPVTADASLAIAPPGYYETIHSGKIRAEKAEIARFVPDSKIVEFTNGKSEEFDVVICATGFTQEFPFFDKHMVDKFQIPQYSQSGRVMDSPFRLYRSIVPIKGPSNIGFIGFQNAICNCSLYEAQANWLGEYFLKNIQLPSEEEMTKDVDKYLAWEKKQYRNGGVGCFVFLNYIHMFEALLEDMKISTTRKNNFLTEYFFPIYPERYQYREEKVRQRKIKSSSPLPKATAFYFSFSTFILLLAIFVFIWRYLL